MIDRKILATVMIVAAILAASVGVSAQGYVEYEYVMPSTMRDEFGNSYGHGDLQSIKGVCSIPLSAKVNEDGQPQMWVVALSAHYISMDNTGMAYEVNGREVVNGVCAVVHERPLSSRWRLRANVGAGIYAPLNDIGWRSVLGMGGAVFVCRLNRNLELGGGAAITNSYGIPMVMPMLYLNWHPDIGFDFKVDMSGGLTVSAGRSFGTRFRLDLTAVEMDGFSAVRTMDGQSRIYSQLMVRSFVSASYRIGSHASLFASFGGNWARAVSVDDRSLKGFIDGFKDDREGMEFRPAPMCNAGVRLHF